MISATQAKSSFVQYICLFPVCWSGFGTKTRTCSRRRSWCSCGRRASRACCATTRTTFAACSATSSSRRTSRAATSAVIAKIYLTLISSSGQTAAPDQVSYISAAACRMILVSNVSHWLAVSVTNKHFPEATSQSRLSVLGALVLFDSF